MAEPAPWGTGLVFLCPEAVPVGLAHARSEPGSTVLLGAMAEVRTPEHLLAALVGAGVTDAILRLDGEEVPILDGSSGPWWDAICAAGLEAGPEMPARVVRRVIEVAWGHGWARLEPSDTAEVRVSVGWDDPRLPSGEITLAVHEFARVARARTFILASDVERARLSGRGAGANAENTILVTPDQTLGLRFPDEIVRHKALDAIGDLALVGAPFVGRLVVARGSHALHHAVLHAWRESDPGEWAA